MRAAVDSYDTVAAAAGRSRSRSPDFPEKLEAPGTPTTGPATMTKEALVPLYSTGADYQPVE